MMTDEIKKNTLKISYIASASDNKQTARPED